MVKKDKNEFYITYSSDSSGGEIKSGQEYESYPDREDGQISFNILTVAADKGGNRWLETCYTNKDVTPYINKEVYIVVARYYDGDTFGRTYGHWKVVDICFTREEALQLSSLVQKTKEPSRWGYKSDEEKLKVHSEYEKAKKELLEQTDIGYLNWDGYFSDLTGVEIYARILQGELPTADESYTGAGITWK